MANNKVRPPTDIEDVGVLSSKGRDDVRDEIIEAEPNVAALDDPVERIGRGNDVPESPVDDTSLAP